MEVIIDMAYWVHEAGNKNNSLWRFFQCDFISDVNNLPTTTKEGQPQPNDTVCKNKCAPGSQCLCLEDSSVWFLGKDTDKWVKRKGLSSGGSSGGVCGDVNDIEPIPFSSIQSLFS